MGFDTQKDEDQKKPSKNTQADEGITGVRCEGRGC